MEMPTKITEKVRGEARKLLEMVKKSMKSASGGRIKYGKSHSKVFRVNGKTCVLCYTDWSADNKPYISSRTYMFMNRDKNISITMDCLLEEKEKWDKVFEKVLYSFRF